MDVSEPIPKAEEETTEGHRASAAIYDVDGISDGDEVDQSKREVDKVIDEELQQ